jgi:hydroxyacylglutathione hydrolase
MYLDLFDDNPYGENCWLIADEGTSEAIVVDPGSEPATLRSILAEAGKTPVAVLLTHAHVDHARSAGEFAGEGVPVFVHPADALAFHDPEAWSPGFANPLSPVKDLRTVEDGEVLRFAGFSVGVLHTPGHTPGHCCFDLQGNATLLSGDLVFAGAIGRSDFPNSDAQAMRESLRRFLELPDEARVLPGHGPETTVGRERMSNPFLVAMA